VDTALSTKLTIDMRNGLVQAEGREEFVRSVYDDFKERVSRPLVIEPAHPRQLELPSSDDGAPSGDAQAKKARRRAADSSAAAKAAAYRPTFNSGLDLSGLEAFYGQFDAASNSDKILLFAIYLRDKLGISPCTADDIYTCYFTLKHLTKIPTAFLQSFWNAQSRTHYIEFRSATEIVINIAGENHFNQKLKRKGE
jgi:hypothetical protein